MPFTDRRIDDGSSYTRVERTRSTFENAVIRRSKRFMSFAADIAVSSFIAYIPPILSELFSGSGRQSYRNASSCMVYLMTRLFGQKAWESSGTYNEYFESAAPCTKWFALAGLVLCLAAVILKDASGRSIGKRLMNLYIAPDDGSDEIPLKSLILRNLSLIVWPIEGIAYLLAGQRILDGLLGLDVYEI